MHEAIIPRGARQGQSQLKRTCSIFAYEDIKEVHKRRYLLQVSVHALNMHKHTHTAAAVHVFSFVWNSS